MPQRRGRTLLIFSISALILAIAGVAAYWFFHTGGPPPAPLYDTVKTFAGLGREFGEPFGIAVKDGLTYVSDGEAGKIFIIGADSSIKLFAAGLHTPSGNAFTASGDLIVADTGSHTIRSVSPDGSVSTIAGTENSSGFYDGPAHSARFHGPVGVAVAGERIYVSDSYNDRIRVIENDAVSTIAGSGRGFADGAGASAKFDTPLGIAAWNGKLLVADSQNRRIRLVDAAGDTKTLAGGEGRVSDGPLATAAFAFPTAIAVDKNNTIFIADGNSVRAIGRRIFPFVETLSDSGRGYSDGPARTAKFSRPSGIAVGEDGSLLIADGDNQTVRTFSNEKGSAVTADDHKRLRYNADEFRDLQPARWPYDPPEAVRDVAGTLGEIRGSMDGSDNVWFHNGLDIAGSYGETARFVRSEKVLDPNAAQNFGTARELLRMPTMGYIHIRLGRGPNNAPFDDARFIFDTGDPGKLTNIRVARGSIFKAGEPIGTLNSQNHVHLIAGRPGSEMNAIDALRLPGLVDTINPVIESVSLFDPAWGEIETEKRGLRTKLTGNTRVVVRAFDRVDGNPERRKLGIFRLGYQLIRNGSPLGEPDWTIRFDRMPPNEAVKFVYAAGSRSGATGETVFNYIVSNRVSGDHFSEGFLDAGTLASGEYTLRVFAADFFGNTASKDVQFEVSK